MAIVTREMVRKKLVARIEEQRPLWTRFPVLIEYDNAIAVNQSTQSNPYLCVTIVYQDGYQTTLSKNPGDRVLGTIVIEAKAKEGSGTAQANDLLEHFYRKVHMTDTLTPLRTLAARFASSPARNGWVAQGALIPFWFDSIPE